MTLLDRDRADIRAAQVEGNTPVEDYWLAKAGHLHAWIDELERPSA